MFMKVLSCCTECLRNNEIIGNDVPHFYVVNYKDGICEYKCMNGHKNRFVVQNEKYELLFDSAIVAFYDGYNRECVLNISSALECFYEYAIGQMVFFKNEGNYSDVKTFLSKVDKRSECREGTFYGICKIVFGKNLTIKEKMKNLRNDVIHNGYFPSDDETMEYARCVFNFIIESIKLIETLVDQETLINYNFVRLTKKGAISDQPCSTHCIPTFIDSGTKGISFDRELNVFKKRVEYCYGINIEKQKDMQYF